MTEGAGRVIVDATTEDTLAIDTGGRAAIQDQPGLAAKATETTLAAVLAKLDITVSALRDAIIGVGPKTLTDVEATLDSIEQTAGIKKITDELPAGTQEIGAVKQGTKAAAADAWPTTPADASGNPQLIQPDVIVPASTPVNLVGAQDPADSKAQYLSTLPTLDEEDQSINPLAVEGPWDYTAAGSIDAVDETLEIPNNGRGTVSVCITGTWVGRLEFESTIAGTQWCPTLGYPVDSSLLTTDHTSANGTWRVSSGAMKHVRVRASEWTSGTAVISIRASPMAMYPISLDASGAIEVIVGAPSNPKLVNPYYNQSDGALVANTFKRVMTYTVPTGYTAYLIRYTSWQNEAAYSRVVGVKDLGSFDFDPDTYTAGDSYVAPLWASSVEAEITTQVGSSGGDRTVTVTYTNELGVGGRTGTFTVPKNSVVGRRFVLTKQAGDLGVQSIQDVSSSLTGDVGVMDILGFVNLAFHDDLSATVPTETNYSAGAVTFPSGTVVGFEYSGSAVAKQRILEALLQLVEAVE